MRNKRERGIQLNLEQLEGRDVPSSTISGVVFADANNNGVQDAGEAGLAGATVKLIGTDNQNHSVNLSQHTGANGLFAFSNLAPGVYTLQESPAASFIDGSTSAGSLGGTTAIGSIGSITLPDSTTATGYDLGQLPQSAGWTAINSNFNGTSMAAGSTLWFSSVFKASGVGSSPVTLTFANQSISYVLNGTTVTESVPDSVVTLSPTATTATTTFNAATNSWNTTLPSKFSGNGFLGGFELPLPNGLPGGINSVTWQGQLTSDTGGVSVNWQWATAVYTSFNTDYNALGVKPVDANNLSQYLNSDHAGTPEAFKSFVTGGARGGGGSNFTGSLSPTVTVIPPVAEQQQPPASISGFVLDLNGNGLEGFTVFLEDSNGNILASMISAADGSYSFTGLTPGSYQLVAVPFNSFWIAAGEAVGTVNGSTDGTDLGNETLGGISLASGNAGVNYDFYFMSGNPA